MLIVLPNARIAIRLEVRPVEKCQNQQNIFIPGHFCKTCQWMVLVFGKTERSQAVTSVPGTAAGVVPDKSHARRSSVAVPVGSRITGNP